MSDDKVYFSIGDKVVWASDEDQQKYPYVGTLIMTHPYKIEWSSGVNFGFNNANSIRHATEDEIRVQELRDMQFTNEDLLERVVYLEKFVNEGQ